MGCEVEGRGRGEGAWRGPHARENSVGLSHYWVRGVEESTYRPAPSGACVRDEVWGIHK
jgi:hypothetical protein